MNPSEDAAERFKSVTHAYDVLSDPEQRERYDLGSAGGFGAGAGGSFGFGDIFDTFFGGQGRTTGPRSRTERGQDALVRIEIELATHRLLHPQAAGSGRVLVRFSGTEPLARVMVEGEDQVKIQEYVKDIVHQIRSQLG